MVDVRIPAWLLDAVDGARTVPASGATVREVLADLGTRYPALTGRLLDDAGLRRLVNVYVGGTDVRYAAGLSTAVGDRDVVTILPAWATPAG